MVTLNELTLKLSPYEIHWNAGLNYNRAYSGAGLLCGDKTTFIPNHLYIGYASMLPKSDDHAKNTDIVVIQDCVCDPIWEKHFIGQCPASTNPYEMFNDIHSVIHDSKHSRDSSDLLEALLSNRGMGEIIQTATKILGNPLLVADVSGKVYFYTENVVTSDPVWNDVISNGYSSSTLREIFRNKNMCKPVSASVDPVIFPPINEQCHRRMTGKLLTNNRITGYVIVLENNRPFTDEDVKNTALICQVITMEIQKNRNLAFLNGSMDESLICDFLDGHLAYTEMHEERMKITGWRPYRNFFLLTIKVSDELHHVQMSDHYRASFESIQPTCRTAFYNGNIVVLMDYKSLDEVTDTEKDVIAYLENSQLIAGISPLFTDITELRLRYKQSMRALEFGVLFKKNEKLYRYNDFYFYDMLTRLEKVQTIDSFVCQEALNLLNYDAENGTDFYKTCYEYLISGLNMARTAKRLYIHRNTIAYRIQKIQEIAGIDLDNGEDCYRLFLSFKILDLLNGRS